MSKTAAYVENGVVTNLIVVDDTYENSDPNVIALNDSSPVTFGWLWDGTTFTMTQDMITQTYNGLVVSTNGMINRLTAKNDPAVTDWQNYLAALQAMGLMASNPPNWPTRPA
jgi:hypothetical protein